MWIMLSDGSLYNTDTIARIMLASNDNDQRVKIWVQWAYDRQDLYLTDSIATELYEAIVGTLVDLDTGKLPNKPNFMMRAATE